MEKVVTESRWFCHFTHLVWFFFFLVEVVCGFVGERERERGRLDYFWFDFLAHP